MRMSLRCFFTLLTLFLLCLTLPIISGDSKKKPGFKPSETCLECHDDMPDNLLKTPHHTGYQVNCEDCHGTSEEHLDDPEPENITIPSGASGMATCLNCHEHSVHPTIQASNAHAQASVFCSDCHLAHDFEKGPPMALLRETPETQCRSCHVERDLYYDRPFQHGAGHQALDCASCHNPHGGSGLESLQMGLGDDLVCVQCHTEKRGPFIFEHVVGLVGDCLTCHEQHGSSNPKQLTRARIADLCLECHTTELNLAGFGSQPPFFHDLRDPRYQNCTVCHTAIHGSHLSPQLLK